MAQTNDIEKLKYLLNKIDDSTTGIFTQPNEHLMKILNNCRAFLLKKNAPYININPFCDLNEELESLLAETKYRNNIKNNIMEIVNILQNNGWDKEKPYYYNKKGIKVLNKPSIPTIMASREDTKKLKQLMFELGINNNVVKLKPYKYNQRNNLENNTLTNNHSAKHIDFSIPFLAGGLCFYKYLRKCCKRKANNKTLKHIKKVNNALDNLD